MAAFNIMLDFTKYKEVFGGGDTKAAKIYNGWLAISGKDRNNLNLSIVSKITEIPFLYLLYACNSENPYIKNIILTEDIIAQAEARIAKIKEEPLPEELAATDTSGALKPLKKFKTPLVKKEKKEKEVDSEKQKRMDAKYPDGKYFERKMKAANRKAKGKY